MGSLPSLRKLLRAFLSPQIPEEREATQRAWERLPEEVRLDNQVLGVSSAGCAATHGVHERCNLWCSACYLAKDANQAPPLPFEDIRQQLDEIREYLGPWGNTQITSGEVTLLACDDLLRILKYCRDIELSPMLMTNGTVILEDPLYLERLVLEGGLDNLAIHVDTTQGGRADGPRRDGRYGGDESQLDPLRTRFAELIRTTRKRTGRNLSAAHTITVTDEALDSVPDLVRWALANADAFRMLSLQPSANVGRTVATKIRGGREVLWAKICEGLGIDANQKPWHFGDPECSTVVLAFVVDLSGQGEIGRQRLVEVTRKGKRIDAWFLRRLLGGGLAGWRPAGEGLFLGAARLLGRLVRHPRLVFDVLFFSAYRLWTERGLLLSILSRLLRGRIPRVNAFSLVVHHFMDSAELETERGRERLAACAFKVPVDGEMISMCELNGSDLRGELNDRSRAENPTVRTTTSDQAQTAKT
ncbi:MAG: hypothetical protein ACI8QS_002695 [Planctomycetota bacterium]|jgi:hypothetical protein